MRVISLASGSSGNALLIEAGPQRRTKLLVDVGIGERIINDRLRKVGVHPAHLMGVLVTHEHSDHVLGLPSLMKRYGTPVITDPRTYQAIAEGLASGIWRTDSGVLVSSEATSMESGSDGSEPHQPGEFRSVLREELAHFLEAGSRCVIGDIEVTSFPVSHDAAAPCGYLLRAGGCRVCVLTDSGEITPAMLTIMRQADLLILESNHDRQRLLRGPYPYNLKVRILSPTGHLSNDQAADAVLRTWREDGVRWLWLAHLSRTNNTPALALSSMRERLIAAGANLAQIHISVSPPDMGGIWDSTQLWHAPSLWEMSR